MCAYSRYNYYGIIGFSVQSKIITKSLVPRGGVAEIQTFNCWTIMEITTCNSVR